MIGIVFVPVHATDGDPLSVHVHGTVTNVNGPKTHATRFRLCYGPAVVVVVVVVIRSHFHGNYKCVQVGCFRRPQARRCYVSRDVTGPIVAAIMFIFIMIIIIIAVEFLHRTPDTVSRFPLVPVRIQCFVIVQFRRDPARTPTPTAQNTAGMLPFHAYMQASIGIGLYDVIHQVGVHRSSHQFHRSVDPGHPPLILIFHVRTIRPAQHDHLQNVRSRSSIMAAAVGCCSCGSGLEGVRHVKLGR